MIYSKDKESHTKHVQLVLEALHKKDLKLKPEKCEFYKTEIEFLGYIVTTEGLKMDPAKVKAVRDWPLPTTVKETQSFLGFANFYRRFIKGYSLMVKPLTDLTRKDKAFTITQEA